MIRLFPGVLFFWSIGVSTSFFPLVFICFTFLECFFCGGGVDVSSFPLSSNYWLFRHFHSISLYHFILFLYSFFLFFFGEYALDLVPQSPVYSED